MFEYYTATIAVSCFSLILLFAGVRRSNTLSHERKFYLTLLFLIIALAAVSEWMGVLLDGKGGVLKGVHIFVKFIEFSLAPAIPAVFCWSIRRRWVRTAKFLLHLHIVVEFISMPFGFIFYIDDQNIYHHGDFYWIYILAYVSSMIFGLVFISINMRAFQYDGAGFFLLIGLFMVASTSIQLVNSDIRIIYVAIGMAAGILYATLLEMIQQTDALTELLNRTSFDNFISSYTRACKVAFFDVDNFKYVNDTYGHKYGDKALESIGKTILENYRNSGKCFRYGGDEFCVILTKKNADIDTLNEIFRRKIEALQAADPKMPGVSVGHATYDPTRETLSHAVAEADKIMYEIKKESKRKANEIASDDKREATVAFEPATGHESAPYDAPEAE